MKMNTARVGEKVFGANALPTGAFGARLEMASDCLHIFCGKPFVSAEDIEQFESGKFEFNYFGSSGSGSTLLIMKIGRNVLELPFNVNLYQDNRFDLFKEEANSFIFVQLYDSITYEVKTIRVLPLSEKLKGQFVSLWQVTKDNNISQADYDCWLNKCAYSHGIDFNYKNSRQLGYIKGGSTTQELTFVEPM